MICRNCSQEKNEDQFSIVRKKRSNLCYECKRTYDNKYYANNKEKIAPFKVIRNSERTKILKWKILNFLRENGCLNCSENDPIVLDFDHLRDKEYNVSDMVRLGYSWNKISKEISKCQILCSNCHRKKTAKYFGHYRFINQGLA